MTAPLSRRFFARPCIDVARALLGKRLVHGDRSGYIVETDAGHFLQEEVPHALADAVRWVFAQG